MQGAFIDAQSKSVTKFEVSHADLKFPRYTAACVTTLPAAAAAAAPRDVYLEYGGTTVFGRQKQDALSTVRGMIVPSSAADKASIATLNGPPLPPRIQAALACGPAGEAWAFGGLKDVGGGDASAWQPTGDLSSIDVRSSGGGGGGPLSMQSAAIKPAAGDAAWPPARSAAALVFLPASVVGLKGGALLLFGGTKSTDPELNTAYVDTLTTSPLYDDTWLFDLAAKKWTRLAAAGERPPPMMWHSMAVDGSRVMLYGGKTYNATDRAWNRDTNLYILQFPERTWQRAPVTNHRSGSALLTEFPNSGVVPLVGSLALQFENVGVGRGLHVVGCVG